MITLTLVVAVVQEMREPLHCARHTVRVPMGTPTMDWIPHLQLFIGECICEKDGTTLRMNCCNCSAKSMGQSIALACQTAADKPTEALLLAYVIPFCGNPALPCVRKAEDLRFMFGIDLELKLATGDEAAFLRGGSATKIRNCNQCQRLQRPGEAKFLQCAKCHEMYYCSKECQDASWKAIHRQSCRGERAPSAKAVAAKKRMVPFKLAICWKRSDGRFNLAQCTSDKIWLPIDNDEIKGLLDQTTVLTRPADAWLEYQINTRMRENFRECQLDTSEHVYCMGCSQQMPKTRRTWSHGFGMRGDAAKGELMLTGIMLLVCGERACFQNADARIPGLLSKKDEELPSSAVTICAKCAATSLPTRPFLRCSRCQIACYCGERCQRIDWPEHKKVCKPAEMKK